MNYEGQKRSEAPNTHVHKVFGYGRNTIGVGDIENYGTKKTCGEGGKVQYQRGQKGDEEGKGLKEEEYDRGRWGYEE